MQKQIVECIPNFSEARRPEIIGQIIESIKSVPGVHLLDRHSDMDHNRTVLTFIGAPEAVENAAFNAIKTAGELIDLDVHTGEHPRIGAADVVPFVPIRGVSMGDCIELANRLGKRVGSELSIPVYLYEEAARIPERRNLENIRRGQYEALKEEIGVKAERDPDYGPKSVGSAGAVVIGARAPLIAFNVFLNTNDLSIAQKIAKAIRQSSGGFRYLKSLGMLVDGKAQVSMNLTDYRQSPLGRIVETIRREAERYGAAITGSELVGLIPQEAVQDAATWYLQLDNFTAEQVLEQRLLEILEADQQMTGHPDWSELFATEDPVPAGVSLSAQIAAAAAALTGKVVQILSSSIEIAHKLDILSSIKQIRAKLNALAVNDEVSYTALLGAYHMSKSDPSRAEKIQSCITKAIDSPLKIAETILPLFDIIERIYQVAPRTLRSDLSNARTLAKACATNCVTAAETNLSTFRGDPNRSNFNNRIEAIRAKTASL